MMEQEIDVLNSPLIDKLCRKNDPYNEINGILDSTCYFDRDIVEANTIQDAISMFKMKFMFHQCLKTQDFTDINDYIENEGPKSCRNGKMEKQPRTSGDAAEKASMVAKYINEEVKEGYAAKNLGDVLKTIIHAEPKLGLWSAAVVKKAKINSTTDVPYALVDYFKNRFPEFLQSLQRDPLEEKANMMQNKADKDRVKIAKVLMQTKLREDKK